MQNLSDIVCKYAIKPYQMKSEASSKTQLQWKTFTQKWRFQHYDPKLNFGMDSIIEMVNLVFLKNKSYILYEKLPEKISLDCIIWWPF